MTRIQIWGYSVDEDLLHWEVREDRTKVSFYEDYGNNSKLLAEFPLNEIIDDWIEHEIERIEEE